MSSPAHSSRPERAAVAVVIACYNASATLEQTIRSVLAQSEARLELVVVDDGSTDGSAELVRELMQDDARIRLIEQANAGPSAARNRGVAATRAPVVAFIDADDTWTTDHLRHNLAALAADPALGVSFAACEMMDVAGRSTGESTQAWVRDVTAADMLACNPAATCSTIVARRAVFDDVGALRTDMSHAEDQEWLFRVVCSKWRLRGLPLRTVRYRTSPGGLSASTDRMLAGWRTFIDHARRLDPAIVAAHESQAAARMHLYFARRAIRTGQPGRIARQHFARAIATAPRVAARKPLQTFALAGACLAPALANHAISSLRKIRHG